MADKKIPLESNIRIETSWPFIATTPAGKTVILQSESMINGYGDLIYYTETVIDDDPTEQELFKIQLKNPNVEPQVAWGVQVDAVKGTTATPPNSVDVTIDTTASIAEEYYFVPKDS